jgi:DNA-binding NarL/FixJ family response regulator
VANILIIDDQAWVSNLCREGLSGEGHRISATDNIENVKKQVLSYKPNVVLLNHYLKHGFLVWDVLKDIKAQNPDLPVLIVTEFDTHLYCSRLSQADGYLIKSGTAGDELRKKVSALLKERPSTKSHSGLREC